MPLRLLYAAAAAALPCGSLGVALPQQRFQEFEQEQPRIDQHQYPSLGFQRRHRSVRNASNTKRSDGVGKSNVVTLAAQVASAWWWNHRMLAKGDKGWLAFCCIPGVACDQLAHLFNDANDLTDRVLPNLPQYTSSPQGLSVSWNAVTKKRKSVFAYFTRDPLERYLSVFAGKCLLKPPAGDPAGVDHDTTDSETQCCGRSLRRDRTSLEEQVQAFEERALLDVQSGMRKYRGKDYWQSQVSILEDCGMDKFAPNRVDSKDSLTGDVAAQVKQMLQMASVPRAQELADHYFPRGATTNGTDEISNHMNDFYRNASVVKAVMRLYADDYKQLGLPIPEIAVKAGWDKQSLRL